jgi:hypothetical protein
VYELLTNRANAQLIKTPAKLVKNQPDKLRAIKSTSYIIKSNYQRFYLAVNSQPAAS